jgi:hypothetical protein
MAIKTPTSLKSLLIDKQALQRTVDELNQRMGFVRDPAATAQQVQELMLADGIRPEECEFSRELIRMRYQDEEE